MSVLIAAVMAAPLWVPGLLIAVRLRRLAAAIRRRPR